MYAWIRQAALPIAVAVLASIAFTQGWVGAVDRLFYDKAQTLLPEAEVTESIVIAIDERSIAALGRWPWPRSVHAQLLTTLTPHHQADIYFDVLFVDESTPADDEQFAKAMRNHGQVFLAMSVEQVAHNQQPLELLPIPPLFTSAKGVGHVHAHCETDGICRSFFHKIGVGQARWPHLASLSTSPTLVSKGQTAASTRQSLNTVSSDEHHLFLIQQQQQSFIPFNPDDALNSVSYVDVLTGAIPVEQLANKQLFIGATAPGIHDILATPIGRIPGVSITALLHHHWQNKNLITWLRPQLLPWLPYVLGALFAGCLLGLSLLPPKIFLIYTLVFSLCQAGLMVLLLAFAQWWLPLSSYLLATLLFYPLWSWLRLELTMRHLQHQLTSSPVHPLSSLLTQQLVPNTSSNDVCHKRGSLLAKGFLPAEGFLLAEGSLLVAKGSGVSRLSKDPVARSLNRVELATHTQFAAHELLNRSFANLQEGCIIFDEHFKCQLANQLIHTWLSHWKAESVSDLNQVLTMEAIQWPEALKALIESDKNIECEASFTLDDNRPRYFLLRAKRCIINFPNDQYPAITLGLITLVDITARKHSERQREETLNFVSHDLRSPLVSILALIKHWHETQEDHKDHQAKDIQKTESKQTPASQAGKDALLAEIEHYANRNLHYTESLLQLNRAEQLVVHDDGALCDLLAICEDAISQMAPQAKIAQCPLTLNYTDDEFWITGDYELLQRAIVNLISNAIKYATTAKGIEIDLWLEGKHVMLTVKDYGPGMSDSQIEHAFDRFARAPTHQEGAGLGLYFVKQVIQRHAGSIYLEPESDVQPSNKLGCTFVCQFNLQTLDFLEDA